MSAEQDSNGDENVCPNCGALVVYRGIGRRPIWCSTRCRNDASLKRLGARRGAIEVRVVEVVRRRHTDGPDDAGSAPASYGQVLEGVSGSAAKSPRPTPEQALRVIRNDPESVGKLLSHLERRRGDGTLSESEWLPVRNALRLIARSLPPGTERPA